MPGGFQCVVLHIKLSFIKIGPVVLQLWLVENRPFPLLWPLAYTTTCTTVRTQAMIICLQWVFLFSHLAYLVQILYLGKMLRPKHVNLALNS